MATSFLIFQTLNAATAAAYDIQRNLRNADRDYQADKWADPIEHPGGDAWAVPFETEFEFAKPAGVQSEMTSEEFIAAGWLPEPEAPYAGPSEAIGGLLEVWRKQMHDFWGRLRPDGKRDQDAMAAALSALSLAERRRMFAQSALTVNLLCLDGVEVQEMVGHIFAELGLWNFEQNRELIPVTEDLLYDPEKEQLK